MTKQPQKLHRPIVIKQQKQQHYKQFLNMNIEFVQYKVTKAEFNPVVLVPY